MRPSVNQLYVLGATPGQGLELVRGAGVVASGTVDAAGSLAWRELDPGSYTVRVIGDPAMASAPATVTDADDPAPAASFYAGQTLSEGFGYLTTRDGTTLSANVVLPGGAGPFPTVVEYSGYDPSRPGSSVMAQLFTALGYAYVGVNIRGTGCSGGSFRPFEPVQSVDGYDAIEAIAAQPWVKYHRVGMVGVSYPGIEQLYVAQTSRRAWPRSRRCRSSTTPTAARSTPAASSTRASRCPGRRSGRPKRRRTARVGSGAGSTAATPPARPTRRCGCRTPTCST